MPEGAKANEEQHKPSTAVSGIRTTRILNMILKPIFAFNIGGQQVTLLRKQSQGRDSFGREVAIDYLPVTSNPVKTIRKTSNQTLPPVPDKSGSHQPIVAVFIFLRDEAQPQVSDRFTLADQTWEIYQLDSKPATGTVEALCYSIH